MTVTVTCIACQQRFQMDVDDDGWKLPVIQNLVKTVGCNRCADFEESKKRSKYWARKMVGTHNGHPF